MDALQELHKDVQKEIAEVQKDISAGRLEFAELRARLSGKQAGLGIPSLSVPQPSTFDEVTPPFSENPATAPSPSSAVSNVSSGSSSFHLNTLTIDSPTTRMTALPVAGPSRLCPGPHQVQGTSIYCSTMHDMLILQADYECSIWTSQTKHVRARGVR
jgi:hypothetical protein